jgi:hypothetical protein
VREANVNTRATIQHASKQREELVWYLRLADSSGVIHQTLTATVEYLSSKSSEQARQSTNEMMLTMRST